MTEQRYLPAIPDNSLERNIQWWALVLNYAELYNKTEQELFKLFGIPEKWFGKTGLLQGEQSSREFKWDSQK